MSLLPLSIFVLRSCGRQRIAPAQEAIMAVAVVVVMLESVVPELVLIAHRQIQFIRGGDAERIVFVEQGDRSFPIGHAALALALAKMLDELDALASPGERLFVGPADLRRTNYNDTFIYHLMPKLRPATYFLEMNPFSANRPGSRLASDVASADWLVLNRQWDAWDEKNRSSTFYGSDAARHAVQTQFELCGLYGPYELHRRRSDTKKVAKTGSDHQTRNH